MEFFWITMNWNKEFVGAPGVYGIIPSLVAALVAIVGGSLGGTQTEDI
ncbi:sodium:proline symporter [Sphingorhabdus sp. SMR4y]|nr:sodium:proline symporter [Sphingorhabdus sp. SMR4y]